MTRLAKRIGLRKVFNLERIAEPQRTIELACFLKHRLEILTDSAIDLSNHLVNDIVLNQNLTRQVSPLKTLVLQIYVLVQDEELIGQELRARLVAMIKPFRP